MRGLAEGQPAMLDLAEEAIDCRVAAVAGDEATLVPLAAADAAYIPSLGRAAGLVFESAGERVRIRGAVHRHRQEDRLRFVAGGGAGLPARRRAARAVADLAVEVTPIGERGEPAGEARRLRTCDVSIAGVGIRVGEWAPGRGELLELRMELPAGPPITVTARVLRVEAGVAGLELADVAPVDRARLAAYLIAGRVGG
ncbi:MAG TPA: PilZ domain-containing protein [Solirubrobacteraceae bacterium]|nr:PilZ domain-containing protein [Solirubrobacteraceae bacterium]